MHFIYLSVFPYAAIKKELPEFSYSVFFIYFSSPYYCHAWLLLQVPQGLLLSFIRLFISIFPKRSNSFSFETVDIWSIYRKFRSKSVFCVGAVLCPSMVSKQTKEGKVCFCTSKATYAYITLKEIYLKENGLLLSYTSI